MTRPVVMKFGGTSVADGTAIARLVEIVATSTGRRGVPPVVVVSAMSGVTDGLLALAAAAEQRDGERVGAGIEQLLARHHAAVRQLAADPPAVWRSVSAHFDELQALLTATSILRSASPAARDAIASIGELASSRIVAAALDRAGLPAAWVDARRAIVTDDQHLAATPLTAETEAAVAREIAPILAAGTVPVVGGFVGATAAGVTTTLGRGGSDYSGAIVGAALDAGEIQIWTDVDGMLTADPRVIDGTRIVPRLSFAEASELAYFGAKVLHPSTILPAVAKNIPVRILNSRRPDNLGTLITCDAASGDRRLAAVACKRDVTMMEVTSTRMLMAHGFLRRVFEIFERFSTSVDVVTTSEVSVSVTLDDDRHVGAIADALGEFAEVNVERGMAILSAVGDGLRADPRLAAQIVGSLEGFPVRMVSQAASRRNVTVVLDEGDLVSAMERIHAEFLSQTYVARSFSCASQPPDQPHCLSETDE
jgi:aspartate kinase